MAFHIKCSGRSPWRPAVLHTMHITMHTHTAHTYRTRAGERMTRCVRRDVTQAPTWRRFHRDGAATVTAHTVTADDTPAPSRSVTDGLGRPGLAGTAAANGWLLAVEVGLVERMSTFGGSDRPLCRLLALSAAKIMFSRIATFHNCLYEPSSSSCYQKYFWAV